MNANVAEELAENVSDEEQNFISNGEQYLTFVLGGGIVWCGYFSGKRNSWLG